MYYRLDGIWVKDGFFKLEFIGQRCVFYPSFWVPSRAGPSRSDTLGYVSYVSFLPLDEISSPQILYKFHFNNPNPSQIWVEYSSQLHQRSFSD